MKRNSTLLALCLIGSWSAFAQTSTTYSTDTTRVTTTTTNSTLSDTTSQTSQSTTTIDNSSTNSMTDNSATLSTPSSTTTYSSSTTTTATADDMQARNRRGKYDGDRPYKAFAFGIYGGINSTRYDNDNVAKGDMTGRLGYQFGAYLRAGGRVFGQIGAEYLASSSNFYRPGDGTTVQEIRDEINLTSIHIPAYIGVKLVQSPNGVSAVRLQAGGEYTTPVQVGDNEFNFKKGDFKGGTFNLLGNVGFDIGVLSIDFVYHHGLSDVLTIPSYEVRRRILAVNVGLKF